MSKSENIALIYNKYVDDMYAYALFLGFKKDIIMDAIHDVFYKLHVKRISFERFEIPSFTFLFVEKQTYRHLSQEYRGFGIKRNI